VAALDGAEVIVQTFDDVCLRPAAERMALVQAVEACAQANLKVGLFGGRCLAGLPDLLARDRAAVCTTDSCPELALNRHVIQAYTATGAYVTTPGALADWERLVAQGELSRDGLRQLLGASTQRILLLDTGVYDECADRLAALARFAGLPGEILPVGLDAVRLRVESLLLYAQLSAQRDQAIVESAQASRQSADYAMLFDLISALGGVKTETEAVEKIFEVFTLLCAPSRLVYVPLIDGSPGEARARPAYQGVSEATKNRLAGLRASHAWTELGKGFTLRIGRRSQAIAALEVDGFTYPNLARDYLNLALNIAPVLALAISNARQFQKLNAANASLARSNAELAQFAAVVSNDLSAPLRAVSGHLERFAARHADQLAGEAADLIAQAVAGAGHMRKLVDALLAYCRVDMADRAFELTDCEVVVRQAMRNLAGPIADVKATVAFDPLPAVMGDAAQLVLLFQNLIENALKFRGAQPPEVHIRAELQVGEPTSADEQAPIGWLFALQDNGIGIAPEHAAGIFDLFHRAPGQDTRNGTGMSLAICKKIVERHGGRIWFESAPGQGTTFYFTMPAG
jgi:signal transduction histidine kinase